MAKIIKAAEGHEQKKCPRCLVTFEYAPIEVKYTTGCVMGDFETSGHIKCPGCNTDVTIYTTSS